MKKKICKYIKYIFSIMFILLLAIPSFAKLSKNDGESFVTKAEFDNTMAKFNSQIASFESSINSKIDSQITNYLDRNGIWSGKVQSMVPPYTFNSNIAFKEKGTYENNWVKFLSGTTKPKIENIIGCTWYHYDEKLWEGVNKDGMMNVSLKFECDSFYKMLNKGVEITNPSAAEKIYILAYAITAIQPTEIVDIKNNLACLTTVYSIKKTGAKTETFTPIAYPSSMKQVYFFVHRGMDVYFSTCWQLATNQESTCTLQCLNGSENYDGSYNLQILDAKIY